MPPPVEFIVCCKREETCNCVARGVRTYCSKLHRALMSNDRKFSNTNEPLFVVAISKVCEANKMSLFVCWYNTMLFVCVEDLRLFM